MILELAQPLIRSLRVTKRDSERMRQTLLAQRRLGGSSKRRGRGATVTHREYFQDALLVFDINQVASGTPLEETIHLPRLLARRHNPDRHDNGRRRKRRRRRRFLEDMHDDVVREAGSEWEGM